MSGEKIEKIIQAVQVMDNDYDEAQCFKAILRRVCGLKVDVNDLTREAGAIYELAELVLESEGI